MRECLLAIFQTLLGTLEKVIRNDPQMWYLAPLPILLWMPRHSHASGQRISLDAGLIVKLNPNARLPSQQLYEAANVPGIFAPSHEGR